MKSAKASRFANKSIRDVQSIRVWRESLQSSLANPGTIVQRLLDRACPEVVISSKDNQVGSNAPVPPQTKWWKRMTVDTKENWAVGISLVIAAVIVVIANKLSSVAQGVFIVWCVGGAALGFVSGFVAGASEKEGTASELMKYVGGLVVPVLGGIAAVLKPLETPSPGTPPAQTVMTHPLTLTAGFFVAFSLFTIFGIGLGVRRRNGGDPTKPGGIKLAPESLTRLHGS